MSEFTPPAAGDYLAQVSFDTEQIPVGEVRSGMMSTRAHRRQLVPNDTVAVVEPRDRFGAGKKFVDGSAPQSHVANIRDVRSLVLHPASTTHSHSTPNERSIFRAVFGLVCLAVGIQDIDADPRAGFAAAAS
ncbi:hypothetical protein AB4305_28065 [Nocardia sp. 2YAB30]|uniref:hypothetical protein n=1 Tax=unclassified Nocardia TaxID=2637762 RepID=UPI003F9595A1